MQRVRAAAPPPFPPPPPPPPILGNVPNAFAPDVNRVNNDIANMAANANQAALDNIAVARDVLAATVAASGHVHRLAMLGHIPNNTPVFPLPPDRIPGLIHNFKERELVTTFSEFWVPDLDYIGLDVNQLGWTDDGYLNLNRVLSYSIPRKLVSLPTTLVLELMVFARTMKHKYEDFVVLQNISHRLLFKLAITATQQDDASRYAALLAWERVWEHNQIQNALLTGRYVDFQSPNGVWLSLVRLYGHYPKAVMAGVSIIGSVTFVMVRTIHDFLSQ